MSRIKLCILIFVFCILSIIVMLKSPEMHKQTVITDSEYSFVEEDFTPIDINVNRVGNEAKEIKLDSPKHSTPVQHSPVKNFARPQPKPVLKQKPSDSVQTKSVDKSEQLPKQINQPSCEQPSKLVKERPVQTFVKSDTPKHELTEQEEIIAWNRWRSALQNKVMYDTKIAAPLGTAFKFSFTVDKYGNMSNVKVWSTTPCYSDMAVRVIKPVLMSYQHKAILNFPQGTKRTITNVNGGFVISRTTQYSTPSDYSDYERVKR